MDARSCLIFRALGRTSSASTRSRKALPCRRTIGLTRRTEKTARAQKRTMKAHRQHGHEHAVMFVFDSPQAMPASPKKKTIAARIPSHSPQQRSRAAPTAPAQKPQQVNASHRVDTRGVHIKHSGQRRFNEVTEPVGTARIKVPSEAAVSRRASCSSSRRRSVETKSSRRSSVE
eukprot:3602764-Pleurochrysis_carterae.AAC.1